ncbi:glycosyltransferase [Ruicaihuangia caeni]|uniref:glycosyltransferase n=1 Tax=Ruicaihuangia caeni TaxID=3042517 RepID=UPI00338F2A87
MTGSARPLGSVIIAAHNEAAVIGRTLTALEPAVSDGSITVIVVPNGCRDDTASIARTFPGVVVSELEQASKAAALRAGDALAASGPRIYLDADVVLTARAARDVLRTLASGAIAGRPPHRFDSSHATFIVRRWYAVRERLPSISHALWGAGCYALSVEGRDRFDEFPDILSDDLFIDDLFTRDEITIVPTDPVVVRAPGRAADLVRILRRSYRSQHEVMEGTGRSAAAADGVGGRVSAGQRGQLHDLAQLLRREPWRVADAGIYVAVVLYSRVRARLSTPTVHWERDESSRAMTERRRGVSRRRATSRGGSAG